MRDRLMLERPALEGKAGVGEAIDEGEADARETSNEGEAEARETSNEGKAIDEG